MQKSETLKIVTYVNSVEGRKVTELQVEAWHEVIGDLDFGETMERVKSHYRSESRRIWPADIRRRFIPADKEWMYAGSRRALNG